MRALLRAHNWLILQCSNFAGNGEMKMPTVAKVREFQINNSSTYLSLNGTPVAPRRVVKSSVRLMSH